MAKKADGNIFKFHSENAYLYVNFEVDKIQVQFREGKYETDNEKVAEKLRAVVGVSEVNE